MNRFQSPLERQMPSLYEQEQREVRADIERRSGNLANNVQAGLFQPFVRNPKKLETNWMQALSQMPGNLNGVRDQMKLLVNEDSFKEMMGKLSDANQTQMQEIVDVLSEGVADPPDGTLRNLYVVGKRYKNKDKDEEETWYEMRYEKIQADLDTLDVMIKTYPSHAESITKVRNLVAQYAAANGPKWGMFNNEQRQRQNPTDKAIWKMAGLVGALVAAAAFVGTGLMAWRGKQSFAAPLLYAVIFGLIAKPSFIKGFMGGKYEGELTEVNAALNFSDAQNHLKNYHVIGKKWGAYVDNLMRNPNDAKTFIAQIAGKENDPATQEKIKDYVKNALPDDEEAQTWLTKMIHDKQFPSFAHRYAQVGKEGSRETVVQFIQDENRLAYEAKPLADLVKNEPSPYPAGGTMGPLIPSS